MERSVNMISTIFYFFLPVLCFVLLGCGDGGATTTTTAPPPDCGFYVDEVDLGRQQNSIPGTATKVVDGGCTAASDSSVVLSWQWHQQNVNGTWSDGHHYQTEWIHVLFNETRNCTGKSVSKKPFAGRDCPRNDGSFLGYKESWEFRFYTTILVDSEMRTWIPAVEYPDFNPICGWHMNCGSGAGSDKMADHCPPVPTKIFV